MRWIEYSVGGCIGIVSSIEYSMVIVHVLGHTLCIAFNY